MTLDSGLGFSCDSTASLLCELEKSVEEIVLFLTGKANIKTCWANVMVAKVIISDLLERERKAAPRSRGRK